MDLHQLKKRFNQYFGEKNSKTHIAFSPVVINLMGESFMQNGGFVLACAINRGIWLLIRENNENVIRLRSENAGQQDEVQLDEIDIKRSFEWVNYPMGVINLMRKSGASIEGFDMLFWEDNPLSARPDISAAMEMATAVAVNHLFGLNHNMIHLIEAIKSDENGQFDENYGLMDKLAIGISKKEHAVLMNCQTYENEIIPLDLQGCKLVIIKNEEKTGPAISKSEALVIECNRALQTIQKVKPISSFGEISYREFIDHSHLIADITMRKRAKHIISENQRVKDAVGALKTGNLRLFGKLMNASHNSLKYDLEVISDTMNILIGEVREMTGVIGARLTGVAFGNRALNIVAENAVERFVETVDANYFKRTGFRADFCIVDTSDGAEMVGC
jgi:galactokinase